MNEVILMMIIPFSELDFDNLYPLTIKLENGNIYEGRFTDMRIDRRSLPKGLFAYDIRDCCDGEPCEIKRLIFVNHMGTLITNQPIPEAEGDGFICDYSFCIKDEADF